MGTLGIGAGDNSYVNKFAGNDMLPYTSDDITLLPASGNYGGSWGFVHLDINSDNAVDPTEHIFTIVRNVDQDDDILEISAQSRPEYGVIYESEDWAEYRDFRLEGPTGTDPNTTITDFELNDENGWCGETNAYVYNNLRANQHGDGKPLYYFENAERAAGGYDEIEGFRKSLSLNNVTDDPDTTTFSETSACRRQWALSRTHETRGYLIPVDELAGLADGSLPTLFGWESADLAAYLRDTIRPLLNDDNLFYFHDEVPLESRLPITHLMLRQIRMPIEVNESDACTAGVCDVDPGAADPGQCQAEAHAAYWGVPATGATMRSSHLIGFKDDTPELVFGPGGMHLFTTVPEDASERNLWVYDHFWREACSGTLQDPCGPEVRGRYTYEPAETTWTLIKEPVGAVIDATNDKVFVASGAGAVSAPLPRPLGENERPIEVVADLAEDLTPPDEGGGAGGGTSFQIILRNGDQVVAYADISGNATAVHVGGTYNPATGVASSPVASATGGGSKFGAIDSTAGVADYTRYVLRLTCDGVSLRHVPLIATEDINNFLDLQSVGEELANLSRPSFPGSVATLTIGGSARTVVNTLAVFAAFPGDPCPKLPPLGVGPFLRGDCNGDGEFRGTVTDAVFMLNFNFLGGNTPPCFAACDANGDGQFRGTVTDAVYSLNFNFLGGNAPPAPFPDCGRSTEDDDEALGCLDASGCE
jgi:hypothetical protein